MNWRRILKMAPLFPILTHAYIYFEFSKMRAYSRIQLGDSIVTADYILSEEGVFCGNSARLAYSTDTPMRCYFSDPWRTYEFVINRRTRLVTSKYIYWDQPNVRAGPVLAKIVAWIQSYTRLIP